MTIDQSELETVEPEQVEEPETGPIVGQSEDVFRFTPDTLVDVPPDQRLSTLLAKESAMVDALRAQGNPHVMTTAEARERHRQRAINERGLKNPRQVPITEALVISNVYDLQRAYREAKLKEAQRELQQVAERNERLERHATSLFQSDLVEWQTLRSPRNRHHQETDFNPADVKRVAGMEAKAAEDVRVAHEKGDRAWHEITSELEVSFFHMVAESGVFGPDVKVRVSPVTKHGDYFQQVDAMLMLEIPEDQTTSRQIDVAVDFSISNSREELAKKLHQTVTEPFVTMEYGSPMVPQGTHAIRSVLALDRDRATRMADRYYLEKAATADGVAPIPNLEKARTQAERWQDDYVFTSQIVDAMRAQQTEQLAELREKHVPEEMLDDVIFLLEHLDRLAAERESRPAADEADERARTNVPTAAVADREFVHQARVSYDAMVTGWHGGLYSAAP